MGASAAHARGQLTQDGIWVSPVHRRYAAPTPGLLLDRDGILVKHVHHLCRPQDVEMMPGAVALLRWAASRGLPVAVVSNQSGIARGLFGWDEFAAVQEEISDRLTNEGVSLDLVIACPFHPEHTKNWDATHAYWRKPGPGMLEHAAGLINLDLGRSWFIGDTESDIDAARAAGLAGAIRVAATNAAALQDASPFPVFQVAELDDAIKILRPQFV